MDLVSIIVPVYNVAEYLPKCLDSIVNQTYVNIEIILVNDGSNDSSGEICDEYAQKDNRIIVIHQNNSGVAEARINGFRNSSGTFIVFVDSDDYIAFDCIEKMISIQHEYEVALVCSQYLDVENGIEKPTPIRPKLGYYDKKRIINLLKSNFLFDEKTKIAGMSPFLCTKLIKRGYVEDVLTIGRGLFYGEDQVGVFNLLCNIPNMYVMENVLYYYVKREGQATQKYDERLWGNIEKYFELLNIVDREGYLVNQLQGRRLFYSFTLVNILARNSNSITAFISVMNSRHQHKFIREAVCYDVNGLTVKQRIMYLLIKTRSYYLYYLLYKLKGCV